MSTHQQSEVELQRVSELADARLDVAEEFGWAVGAFAALAAHLKWESWLVTLPVAVGTYALAIYRYRKRAAMAEDNYCRAAGLGKYAGNHGSSDV